MTTELATYQQAFDDAYDAASRIGSKTLNPARAAGLDALAEATGGDPQVKACAALTRTFRLLSQAYCYTGDVASFHGSDGAHRVDDATGDALAAVRKELAALDTYVATTYRR